MAKKMKVEVNPLDVFDQEAQGALTEMLAFCRIAECRYCAFGDSRDKCEFTTMVSKLKGMVELTDGWDPGLSEELETVDGQCQHCTRAPDRGSEVCTGAYGEICDVWEQLDPEVQKKAVEAYNTPAGLAWRAQLACDNPRIEDCGMSCCAAHETCKREYRWK